eukprot:1153662-Lingulodinium_polyedra.AAC.1
MAPGATSSMRPSRIASPWQGRLRRGHRGQRAGRVDRDPHRALHQRLAREVLDAALEGDAERGHH